MATDINTQLDNRDKGMETSEDDPVSEEEKFQFNFPLDASTKRLLDVAIKGAIFDTVWDNIYSYNTDFQSLDGFTTNSVGDNSGVNLTGGGAQIGANDTGGGAASATIHRTISSSSRFNFDEESRFRFELVAGNGADNFDLDVTIGAPGNNTAYGFRIEDTTIKGITVDSNGTNEVNLGTTFTTSLFKLEARFFPGNRVDFMIDNEPKGSSTSNLPITSTTILWRADIDTTSYSGNDRNVTIYFVDYFQLKTN